MKNEQLLIDLSDEQCEKVVGGVGRGTSGGNSAGFFGWQVGGPGLGLNNNPTEKFSPTPIEHGANDTSVVHPK
jgi:hypothetical protein